MRTVHSQVAAKKTPMTGSIDEQSLSCLSQRKGYWQYENDE
ncbi:hypothetical protein D515_01322 [Grimontia indica]|uniref:Uncharacterized protein n=1 Tax=Grimontia indica TaxID=1056512 RepID=R1GTL2_9GAMM|nr:hypothetical protein D515_01322 [Grimontia indica]